VERKSRDDYDANKWELLKKHGLSRFMLNQPGENETENNGN